MNNPSKYHELVKNEQHVFLFAVSGRSSSTAFQRIINSSNKVWMWGETKGILRHLLLTIYQMTQLNARKEVKAAANVMYNSYTENKHLSFYANAIANLDTSIDILKCTISNFLKPWAPKVKRFGVKEIDGVSIDILETLKEIYPNSIFVFCFRNPLKQWPSLCQLDLSISDDLDQFLFQYCMMASCYMEFAQKYRIKAFIENNDLRDLNKIDKIVKYLNISKIDELLIDVTVHSLKPKKINAFDRDKILKSVAYQSYLKMQEVSQSFYQTNI